mmetsp:Transcript_53412/g.95851  ORF Transcript_53412/g.95851 Transcript_53412/m.95851 type:complete len:270 (+) Transcript_53412:22-831(+)
MIAVLSPAKTLDMSPVKSLGLKSSPAMVKRAEELLPLLKKLTVPELKKMMGLSDDLAKLNAERYAKFSSQPSKAACLAFDGPAFRGLSAGDFSQADQKIAQGSIRILCGLYGVLRPLDSIRPYRLEMGTKMKTPRGTSLYDFWGDEITEQLSKELADKKTPILVNCASQEYWKSVRPKKLPKGVLVVTCDFPGPAVFAKKARGMMCRHIVKQRVTDVGGLKKFVGDDVDRYSFCASKSTATKLTFLRVGGAMKRPAAALGEDQAKKRRL